MKRGEVRWYKFASPDRKRPVLLLTRTAVMPYLGEITIAPITSKIRDIPSEVVLNQSDGMPKDCAINCDHIGTIPKGKLGALITTLRPEKLREVARAVSYALDLV